MAFWDELIQPSELTGFVREMPAPANWTLNEVLPDVAVRDFEAVVRKLTKTNRAAKFRAYDAETPIGKRDSIAEQRVQLPPLGQKTVVAEEERIRLEQARLGGDGTQALIDAVYDDAEVNARAVHARMELARGDVLTDGKVTITENGIVGLEADYGLAGGHLVAPGTLWSTVATATPLADLLSWRQTYINDAGEPPGKILTSSAVIANLLRNAEIRQIAGSVLGTPSIVSRAALDQVLTAHGLPMIVEYDAQIDVDGSTTRPIAADRLIMLPADPRSLGYTAWGITAEALDLAGGDNPELLFEDAPGLVGVVMREGDPVRTWTKVTAVGLPIIEDASKLLVADVQ